MLLYGKTDGNSSKEMPLFFCILEHYNVVSGNNTNTKTMYSRQSQTVYSQSLSLSNELVIPTSRKPPAVTFKTWNSFCRIFCAWCYFPSSGINL